MNDSVGVEPTQVKGRADGSQCFVCGPNNPLGMQIKFRIEAGLCKAEYTPPPEYCGYTGVTHGGILFSLLDDVMANYLYLQGERAMTGNCEIKFRETAATGHLLLLEGEQLQRKRSLAKMRGRAIDAASGNVVAEATATFVVVPD